MVARTLERVSDRVWTLVAVQAPPVQQSAQFAHTLTQSLQKTRRLLSCQLSGRPSVCDVGRRPSTQSTSHAAGLRRGPLAIE